jgi:tetratricopeptide (TPR) repeat protein
VNLQRKFATLSLITLVSLALGQTFEVGGQGGTASSGAKQHDQGGQNLSWGSSIEVARQARAAQDALKRGDYAAAATYAEQAAKSAPQNTELWFLLGYTARVAGRYPLSVDAYQRGLERQPNSVQGLSGLAQTYAKMGRTAEARTLLVRVVEMNPIDVNNLQLAGELLLDSDPQRALDVLRRADSMQPSARAELLIARAYLRLQQRESARQWLDRAKARAPHDPEVLRVVAGQYRESGQYDLAVSTLQSVPVKTPDVQAELAYSYELAGRKKEAAELYTQLASNAKGNVGLALSAAQALVNQGQTEAARIFLQQVQQVSGSNYRLHAIQGQIAAAEDRIPDAIREYQLAISNLPPTVPEGNLYPLQLRLTLYELYGRMGNEAEAKQQLAVVRDEIGRVQVADSSRPEFLRLRAVIAAGSGNLDAANRDLNEALRLAPSNLNILLNHASLLWRLGHKEAARKMYLKALEQDNRNRLALTSLGSLARDMGDSTTAENYFMKAAQLYPDNFGPYLALADLYTAKREFSAAQANYEAAYRHMPQNTQIVAGGANAALESRNLDLAKHWLDRASGPLSRNPQVMRERQRYLTWKGQYEEAARLGRAVIAVLPQDPQAPVYLAYDLYYLGQYEDAVDLAEKYEPILPNNKDLALIAGYVHARGGQFDEALRDFTRALDRDPKMATGYANRGFVLTDLRQANKALLDFRKALLRRGTPRSGIRIPAAPATEACA